MAEWPEYLSQQAGTLDAANRKIYAKMVYNTVFCKCKKASRFCVTKFPWLTQGRIYSYPVNFGMDKRCSMKFYFVLQHFSHSNSCRNSFLLAQFHIVVMDASPQ